MKKTENSIKRQFFIFFVLPIFLIIGGAVLLDIIIVNSSKTIIESVPLSPDQAATEVVLQLTALEITDTLPAKNVKSTETSQVREPTNTKTTDPKPIENTEMLFYAGFIVCGGILLLIMIAGGVLFMTPSKK